MVESVPDGLYFAASENPFSILERPSHNLLRSAKILGRLLAAIFCSKGPVALPPPATVIPHSIFRMCRRKCSIALNYHFTCANSRLYPAQTIVGPRTPHSFRLIPHGGVRKVRSYGVIRVFRWLKSPLVMFGRVKVEAVDGPLGHDALALVTMVVVRMSFGCKTQCPNYHCSVCNPRRVYIPTPRYPPPSTAYLNPYNSAYPMYPTGPPLSAWTSPRTTVVQYSNGRMQFDDNGRYTSYYKPQWPSYTSGWYYW
ncbi:hypothetical protein C8R44DRAFT_871893 [Mycena epipterygia]|nr:hypothetical protein C8R44DRAFT_871893 [Mycena epipterygia]